DEAAVAGASFWQTAVKIEFPLNLINFLNLFRMLWGLAWATIIAAEMLGVRNGLGFRLLDLRYLLKYSEMLIYLGIMGIIGVCTDKLLEAVIKFEAEKING
ncbi:MAG: ABC transporter permease subunit, partial [Candidatus Cloacimonetes bacterium]|nr:ABC transporter permease subunit [Candidatus Cloacimonadota bacterium]